MSRFRNHDHAAATLNRHLPSRIAEISHHPGYFTLHGDDWMVVVFCHWWINRAVGVQLDSARATESARRRAVDRLVGKSVTTMSFDLRFPDVVHLELDDGDSLSFHTDSDFEPWMVVVGDAVFTASRRDFRATSDASTAS